MTVTVREVTADDAAALGLLRALWTGSATDTPDVARGIAGGMAAEGDRRTTWLALDGQDPVGMVSMFEYRRMPSAARGASAWGYIGNMFVLENRRGRGIGRALLDAALRVADARGYARVVLSPSDEALDLYLRAGFIVPDADADGDRLLVRQRPTGHLGRGPDTRIASQAGIGRSCDEAMRFGLFGGAQAPRSGDGDPACGFRDYVETNVEAERLGFYSTFLVEHHFSGSGQVSSPLDLLSWVAALTTSIRVGTAVLVLPWHDPVLLAERAATLDLLSGGRLDFGVGKGYRHSEFAGFCVPPEEAEARFDESLTVILKAWSSDEPFSHSGRFWHYDGIVVEPPTAQKPHPPLWIAAGSPESVRKVAALGANLLLDQFASVEAIGERIALFKAECEARERTFDPMDVAVARNLYVARDADDASAALAEQARVHDRMIERSRGPNGSGRSHIMAYAGNAGATEAHALFGPPTEIIAGLEALRAVGVRYVLISGGEARPSMQRFAAEVMPAFAGPKTPSAR